MRRHRFLLRCVYSLLSVVLLTEMTAWSGLTGRAAADDEEAPVRLVIRPAAAPRPALRYQLLPTVFERRPGNAAVYYGKIKAERTSFFADRDKFEKIYHCLDAPLEEILQTEEVHYGGVIKGLTRAARCETCDWQLPILEDGIDTLLPEIQQSREFARLLLAYARRRIAEGRFDEALEALQSGYALGRHLADGPTIVNGLVGIAVADIMSGAVQELIQQDGAPNLYWALTYMPQPLLDMRRNVEGDMLLISASFPELQDLDTPIRDPGYWRHQCWTMGKRLARYGPNARWHRPAVLTARVLRGYPLAKRDLIARGMSPKQVEEMPVGQVILTHTARVYEELLDEVLKVYFLPYPEAEPRLRQVEERLFRVAGEWEETLPLAATLLPAAKASRTAFVRIQRRIAVLRVVEALRLYGAAHGGRLPKQLGDVTEVPIPADPVTGRPFDYRLDGHTAALEGPPLPGVPLRLEISFASGG